MGRLLSKLKGQDPASTGANRPASARGERLRGPIQHTGLLAAVAVGTLIHLVAENPDVFLYYFFLPVTVAAVLWGRGVGSLYAGVTVILILTSLSIRVFAIGDGMFSSVALSQEEMLAPEHLIFLFLWVSFLILDGYFVGLASERTSHGRPMRRKGSEAMSAVERERARTAYDIHDGIAQTANAAVIEADILEALTEDAAPEIKTQVGRLKGVLASGTTEIRSMIGQLRPPALSADEFESTLRGLVDGFSERTEIKVELSLDPEVAETSDSMRICVYRVTQEALSNIEHHAQASRVRIAAKRVRRAVLLLISDDGIGFDAQGVLSANGAGGTNGHFGVNGMRERVSLLAGSLSIDSAPQEGTVLRAYIPTGNR